MRMQRRSYGGSRSGSGIDWKRTIISCAIIIVVISVIQMILSFFGIGAIGLLILCLGVIAWYFLPGIIRNMKIQHRTKSAEKRDPVGREELLDLEK